MNAEYPNGSSPNVLGFAVLADAEAIARGILISVFPLAMYRALQDASVVSEVYFFVGVASLLIGLSIPYLIRFVPRLWIYAMGTMMFVAGALTTILEGAGATIVGLSLTTFATVTTFVCLNAYVLDYVSKTNLAQGEIRDRISVDENKEHCWEPVDLSM